MSDTCPAERSAERPAVPPPAAEGRPSPPGVPRWPLHRCQPSWQITPLRSPSAVAAARSSSTQNSSTRHNPRRAAISPRSGRRHSTRTPSQFHLIPERGGAEGAAGPRTSPVAGGARLGPSLSAEGGGAVPEMVGVARCWLQLARRKMAGAPQPPQAVGHRQAAPGNRSAAEGRSGSGGPSSYPAHAAPAVARPGARRWALPAGTAL